MSRLLTCIVAVSALLASAPAFSADRYSIDKSHTRILFFVNHLGFSDMVGDFTKYSGEFHFDPNKPEESTIDITLDPSGIRTSSEALDEKLQNEHFFNTEKFPDIRFVSKSITITGEKTGEVLGELTMLGVTNPVTLYVTFNKADYNPYSNVMVAGFSARATVKRSEFGMDYLVPAVSDEVRLEVHMEGENQDRKEAEALK